MTGTTEHEYKDAIIVGATFDELNALPFYNKQIEIGVGRFKEDKALGTLRMTRGKLLDALCEFERGDKDGHCLLQGPVIDGRRLAKNSIANHIMMLDCDTGTPIALLEKKVRDRGLAAVIWTTYSHMKATSTFPEDMIVSHARAMKLPLDDAHLSIIVMDYLATKRYEPEIINSVGRIDKEHVSGGVKYIVHHAPMPRARILFWLKEPYVFATAKATQSLAIQDWKEAYAGVAEMLGVDYDASCVDPSRLMYFPRLPPSVKDAVQEGYDVVVIPGNELDLDIIPRIKKGQRYTEDDQNELQKALMAHGVAAGGADERGHLLPNWLLRFAKKHGDDLEIVDLMATVEDPLSQTSDKAEFVCPNEDRHTEQKQDDRAFCVWNASGRDNGFDARCQHATCKEDSKGDRLWWLWKLCEKYGWDEDHLLEFCPNARAEHVEDAERVAEAEDNIEAALTAATVVEGRATAEAVSEACRWIAEIPDAAHGEELFGRLAEVSGWSRTALRPVLTQHKAALRADRASQADELRSAAQVPNDKASSSVIWMHWPIPDQCQCAFKRFELLNNKVPTLFRKPEGGYVIVENNTTHGVRITDVSRDLGAQLQFIMMEFGIRFVGVSEEGIEGDKPVPGYVLTHFLGGMSRMNVPELEKVNRVPVFSKEGHLITEPGYNPHLRMWYDPGDTKFIPLPETVTDEDVETAAAILDEPKRDFPFSDAFYSVDPEPLRIDGDVDDEGFPLPNYKRGAGSRANYDAMVIQPFVRNLINGPTPQYHIDKSAVGTGAGFLVDVAWIIAEGGSRAEVKTIPHDNHHIKAMITSSLREGKSILFLDNIQDQVDSPDLAAALTAGTWSDRIFGKHENVTIPIRCVWVMAGNRIGFNRDMMRRNVPIFMNAETPNPAADRPVTFYKYQNLHDYVVENRTKLVWAIHVLVKNWLQKGRPRPVKSPVLQSFNDYSHVLGGILEAAGIPGFLSNISAYLDARNVEESEDSGLVRRVWEKHQDSPQFMSEWLAACEPSGKSGISAMAGSGAEYTLDPALGLTMITSRTRVGAIQQLSKYWNEKLVGATFKVDDEGTLVTATRHRNRENVWTYTLERV